MLLQSCSVMMCSSFGAGRLIAGSVALVVIAAGCSSGRGPEQQASPAPDPASMSAAPPASTAPTPEPGERSTPRWPIEHVVFLIKENRTFDNLFGTFPGANGVSFGYDRGVRRPLTQGTDGSIGSEDIPHCYTCSLEAWNRGSMDGFNQGAVSDRWAYTQLHRAQLPN